MTNEQQAVALQEKLEFYFVGLVFTLLGLSVQTFVRDRTDPWHYFDLLGWLFLFCSGLSGLLRLETMFKHFKFHARKDQVEAMRTALNKRGQLEAAQELVGVRTERSDLASLVALTESEIATAEKWIAKNQRVQTFSYHLAKWAFVGGLLALFVSRSFPVVWK